MRDDDVFIKWSEVEIQKELGEGRFSKARGRVVRWRAAVRLFHKNKT